MEKLNQKEKDTFVQLLTSFKVEKLKPDNNWESLDKIRDDLCK